MTIQTESERQLDKLRRKGEKRSRRINENGSELDLLADNFDSLVQASEKKGPFDDIIGTGKGPKALSVTSLPQGTMRKHLKGYEEVRIPSTPVAQMKEGERLVRT